MVQKLKLIKRAQKGDNEAFIELIKIDELRLYNTAFKILGNEYDTTDVLQETILSAYKNISKLKKPKYFYTWLYRILINQCNKFLNEKENLDLLLDTYQSNDKKLEPFHDIHFLIGDLTERYKIPILLHYQNGFSIKEIAQILDEPEGTVKSKLSRGRALIKKEYEEIQGGIL